MMKIYIGVHDRASINNNNIYGVESIIMVINRVFFQLI